MHYLNKASIHKTGLGNITYIVVLYHVLNVLDSKTFLKHLIRQKNTATQVDDFKLLSDRRLRNT